MNYAKDIFLKLFLLKGLLQQKWDRGQCFDSNYFIRAITFTAESIAKLFRLYWKSFPSRVFIHPFITLYVDTSKSLMDMQWVNFWSSVLLISPSRFNYTQLKTTDITSAFLMSFIYLTRIHMIIYFI